MSVAALAALAMLSPLPAPGEVAAAVSPVAVADDAPPLLLRGGVAVWRLAPADFGTPAARLHLRTPCLRLRYPDQDVSLCLVKRRKVRVHHSNQGTYGLRATRTREPGGRLLLKLRIADLMLPKGTATLVQTCAAPRCDPPRYGEPIVVTRLRLSSCRAAAPWYVTAGTGKGRAVALTFDDGPWSDTGMVLRTLHDLGVPATFFIVGRNGDSRRAELRRMAREGHQLANHTWNHADLTRRTDSAVHRELGMTDRLISETTQQRTCAFRAPYAAESSRVIGLARGEGLVTVNWNVDPRDWTPQSSRTTAERVLRATQPGSIIILHDGAYGSRTAAALPSIVRTLRARGYRFLTLAELLDLTPRYER